MIMHYDLNGKNDKTAYCSSEVVSILTEVQVVLVMRLLKADWLLP